MEKIMNNTNKFTGKAKVYADSRPGYPKEFIEYLKTSAGLRGGSVAADIGSGTGKLSAELLKVCGKVVCVEPNDDMRFAAERALGGSPGFVSVKATAENTTLADKSVDVVTAAQSFHWFDADAFKRECKRILKPGGKAVLVWNSRDGRSPLVMENAEICRRFCKDFKGFSGGIEDETSKIYYFFGGRFEHIAIQCDIVFDKEKFILRALSASYSPTEDDAGYDEYIAALESLFDKYSDNGLLVMPNILNSYMNTGEL